MPFSAIDENGNQFNIADHTRRELNKIAASEFGCIDKACGGVLKVKAITSKSVQAHFAHKRGTGTETCRTVSSGGESKKHKAGKLSVMQMYNKRAGATVIELEVIDGDIIADVGVYMIDGKRVCHEIELSNPSPSSLAERTNKRHELGWNVVWWFDTDSRKAAAGIGWVIENMDWYGLLSFRNDGEMVVADAEIINAKSYRRKMDDDERERRRRVEWAKNKRESLIDAYNALGSSGKSYPNPFQSRDGAVIEYKFDFGSAESYLNERIVIRVERSAHSSPRGLIGKKLPTSFIGGVATITAYDAKNDVYTSKTGLLWRLSDGVLHSYYEDGYTHETNGE